MPIYSYLCLDCGHRYDELERFEDRQVKCPKCSEGTVKRYIETPPTIAFNGVGWPSNDAKTVIGAR